MRLAVKLGEFELPMRALKGVAQELGSQLMMVVASRMEKVLVTTLEMAMLWELGRLKEKVTR